MKNVIYILLLTSLFAQTDEVDKSSKWGVYAVYQSLQISGMEDDASDEELGSFSTDRLGSYYIGLWRNTDWTIGSLPVTVGAELGHRGTTSKTDLQIQEGASIPLTADILVTYLDLWASANYAMSDKFNLWFGPMVGFHLDDEVKFFGLEIPDESMDLGFDDNDFGILVGAGYSINEKMSINAGLYRGLKDHDGGKFNNFFVDLGYSF